MANRNLTANDRFPVFLRREDDGHFFIVAVFDMSPARVGRILGCNDHENPADDQVAYDLAIAYQYAGMRVPQGVFDALDGVLPTTPPRRRVYSAMPWSSNTGDVDNLSARFDATHQLVQNHGSMSHRGDHRLLRELADEHGFPSATEIPMADMAQAQQRVAQLGQQVRALQQTNATLTADLALERQRVATANAVTETLRNLVTPGHAARGDGAGGGRRAAGVAGVRRRLDDMLDDDSAEE